MKKRCSPVSADLTHGSLGVRFDSVTGLHYMRQRWYDGQLQRFISRDPIGVRAALNNLYHYAANNPAKYLDPSGLDPSWFSLAQSDPRTAAYQAVDLTISANSRDIATASTESGGVPTEVLGAMLSRERINDSRTTWDNGLSPSSMASAHGDPNFGTTNHEVINAYGPGNVHQDVYEAAIGQGSWSNRTRSNSMLAAALELQRRHDEIVKRGVDPSIPNSVPAEDRPWIEAIVRYNIGDGPYGGWGSYSESVRAALEAYRAKKKRKKCP